MGQHRMADREKSGATTTAGGPRALHSRRRFLGYVIAAPTLVVAAEITRQSLTGFGSTASATALPSGPQLPEVYDLLDAIRDFARPTANLIRIEVQRDGTVAFALPRSDNGQGIITSSQMIIAEEMDLEVSQVRVTLADARPELLGNQLTGGSSTTYSTYTPIRVAAAIAKGRLLAAASAVMEEGVAALTSRAGVITSAGGRSIPFSELTERAASSTTQQVQTTLKSPSSFSVIGTSRNKSDARAMVTGQKKFVLDLAVPDALPTVVCRAPDLNGTPASVDNLDAVRAMPGVTDVATISTGVAVRARTFGQAVDGVRALQVQWEAGTVAGESDESILDRLRAAELPLKVPAGPGTVEGDFVFYFKSNSSLEPNCAIADVRADRAEVWGPMKTPIAAQTDMAEIAGLPVSAVTVHVTEGGGSFGRKLFFDAALEAVEASKAMGKPVRLMWTRADDSRQGRAHPMATSRVRATVVGDAVLNFDQAHTSVGTDFTHGFGDAVTAAASRFPAGNFTVAQGIFELTQVTPYNFGVNTRMLNEVDMRFNTGSMRNIYSPDTAVARELIVDQIGARMGKDPYEVRGEFLKSERMRAVLDAVAEAGDWGRSMPAGTAQGIAFHTEYKGMFATLVEIDCRPATVNRPAPQSDANPLNAKETVTGPRVTKVVHAVDVGLPINPRGLEAQSIGGISDGIALVLTSSMHLRDGHFVEASWDNYFYTRTWNTPPEMQIIVMPATTGEPGGAGESAVAPSAAAVACAYARAVGEVPTFFPINHQDPLPFRPKPLVPPIPESPRDGLKFTY